MAIQALFERTSNMSKKDERANVSLCRQKTESSGEFSAASPSEAKANKARFNYKTSMKMSQDSDNFDLSPSKRIDTFIKLTRTISAPDLDDDDASPARRLLRRSKNEVMYLPTVGQRFRVLPPSGVVARSHFNMQESSVVSIFKKDEMVSILECLEDNVDKRIRLHVVSEAGVAGWITYATFDSSEIFLAVAPEDI